MNHHIEKLLLTLKIKSTVQQLITSLLSLGSFISSLAAGFFSTYIGRRPALWLACLIDAGTTSIGILYFGRLLLGLANGFLVTFSNIYTAEAAPAHLRGVMVALFAYWVTIGSILGTTVDNYTQRRLDRLSYRIPLACLYIVPFLLFFVLFFVPESPRWLLHRGKEGEARRSLERLRGDIFGNSSLNGIDLNSYHENEDNRIDDNIMAPSLLELEWAEMVKGVKEEKHEQESVSALDMFRGKFV